MHQDKLAAGLEDGFLTNYSGARDGGLAHIAYWTLDKDSADYRNMAPREQAKVLKIQANRLHSRQFQPDQVVAGQEACGVLRRGVRTQHVTLKLPVEWNGKLVVCGTPGLRNEYAGEGLLAPWLLAEGYAVIAGDKGLPNGIGDMLSGRHPTRHWGAMMLDLARFGRKALRKASGRRVTRIYAMGLSNGGYQVRRALEIDHMRRSWFLPRVFDGGLDWSGTYWADARTLDRDGDGRVSVGEYARANTMVGTSDRAALAMGWAYAPDTLTTPGAYATDPPFAQAHTAMTGAGFAPQSALFWGYYNTNFDSLKENLPQWKGVGYYNLNSYLYRAELLGHDHAASSAYSCFADPQRPEALPPLYNYLATAVEGGWTPESIKWALKNANTGRFSAPLLSLHGLADGLLGYQAHGAAYRETVEKYGRPDLHRLYTIENGGHVDADADGTADFDFDGEPGDESVATRITPMQGYVQRAFHHLVDWVERGVPAPEKWIDSKP